MTMDRAYMNRDMGRVICCWNANSADEIAGLFEKAGVAYDEIIEVQEVGAEAF